MSAKSNVVMAFTEEEVAKLTGITIHQLRYWDRTGFFRPAFAAENRREAFSRVYSFKDVVSLRVLNVLLNQYRVSVQHLRQVSEKLCHLADDRWIKTTLYVLKRRVNFVDPDTDQVREVVSGQYALGIPLAEVMADTRRDVTAMRRRDPTKVGAISQSRAVAHNAAVVGETRVSVAAIKRFSAAGYSMSKIMEEYPDLTEQDIANALAYDGLAAA